MHCSVIEHSYDVIEFSNCSTEERGTRRKAPVKRSQLFIQQRTTFVVKEKFLPFDHLVVCCCIMLYVVVSCCMLLYHVA